MTPNQPEPSQPNLTPVLELEPEVIYRVYARQIGSTKWYAQESCENIEDVIYWRDRNAARNARDYVPGAGREFVAVKMTSTFELLP
jgi:tRNA U54 and U55 pseudouridine synthase Pus10